MICYGAAKFPERRDPSAFMPLAVLRRRGYMRWTGTPFRGFRRPTMSQ